MKSFKIREGSVVIDGILYGQTPNELKIKGKVGNIQSIIIGNRGQFFPYGGEFNDGTIPVTEDSTGLLQPITPIKVRKTKSK